MQYRDTPEKSAEYLRQALPLMTKQVAGFHPMSYAIWYEYVAGINPALRKHVDELLQGGKVLDDKAVAELYRDHIAEIDEDSAKRISEGFDKIMSDISDSTSQAASEAGQFGNVLQNWSDDIAAGKLETTLSHGIADLLDYSREMQHTVSSLRGRLDESRREVEELRLQVHRARTEAMIDGLTGLSNRRSFDIALANFLTNLPPDTPGPCLLIADIDHFKRINDNYGHLFGDKVIRAIATILRENVKGKDVAARYGGEEFVVILPETPLNGACSVAELLRKTVACSRIRRGGTHESVESVTISIGVASHIPGETDLELIARADQALYQSKEQGRNRVTVAGGRK